jgi:hypothetical protein
MILTNDTRTHAIDSDVVFGILIWKSAPFSAYVTINAYVNGITPCHADNRSFGTTVRSRELVSQLLTLKPNRLLTSRWSPNNAELRSNVYCLAFRSYNSYRYGDARRTYASSISRSPVMSKDDLAASSRAMMAVNLRWQWILFHHLRKFRSRRQPAASIIDSIDAIKHLNICIR